MVNPPRKGRKIYHFSTSPVVNTKRHHLEEMVSFLPIYFLKSILLTPPCVEVLILPKSMAWVRPFFTIGA